MVNRNPSWKMLGRRLESWGWFTEKLGKNQVTFERGRQRIVVKRLHHKNKWKIEYYSGKIMDDSVGFQDEYFAKITATEMAILK